MKKTSNKNQYFGFYVNIEKSANLVKKKKKKKKKCRKA